MSDIERKLWQRIERYINLNNALAAAIATILSFLLQDILFERWTEAEHTLVLLAGVVFLTLIVRGALLFLLLRNRKDYRFTRIFNSRLALIEQETLHFLVNEMQEDIAKVGSMLTVRKSSDSVLLAKLKAINSKMNIELHLEDEPL